MTEPGPALVTGASGGIGAAIARGLGARGHPLVLVGRDAGRLGEVAAGLGGGRRARAIACDLADPAAVARLLREAPAAEVLVNAAGGTRAGGLADRDGAELRGELEAGVLALAALCRHYGAAMAAAGRGRILNVGSVAALRPAPGLAAYGASKAFMLALSRALAAEWGPHGVTVTCCLPGPTRTAFAARAGLRPGGSEMGPDEVARAALEALDRGRGVAVLGARNRALYAALGLLPDAVVAGLARRRLRARRGG